MTAADWKQTGTLGAANDEVILSRPGMGALTVQLSGTFTATVTFAATNETGATPTWVAVPATNVNSGASATTATAAGLYRIDASGFERVRARCTAYTDGDVTVTMNASHSATSAGGTLSGSQTVDTEMPAAVALSSDNGNALPATTPQIGSILEVWDAGNTVARMVRSLNNLSDGASGGTMFPVAMVNFNGTTYDRARANVDATYLASAARTATPSVADITTYNARGITVVLDATAAADTPSVVVTIEGKDAVSGKYYTILAGAAITGISTNVYKVALGVTVAANATASQPLPRVIRILPTHADADSITYSVGYTLHV